MISKPVVVDMFCGGGGESAGIIPAYESIDQRIELHAINHWERAIETHAANYPWARHWCTPVHALDPVETIRGKTVDLLWASPECTHHSNARGGRPKSDQSRASSWVILKWVQDLFVRRVIIENVPELLSWGPLDEGGKVIKPRRGETFNAFIASLRSLGYEVDWRILNAADFGAPTTRRRLFIQAVRDGKKIVWPEPTHEQENWRPASSIIDWSIKGTSIFNRPRPLAEATMRRIEYGIKKYWGEWAEPFLVILRGTGTARDIHRPAPAITAGGQHIGLVEPLVLNQWGGGEARPVSKPLATVGATCAHRLIEPFLIRYHGNHKGKADGDRRVHSIGEPLGALDTSNRYALCEPFVVQSEHGMRPYETARPMPTITCSSRGFGLVEPFFVKYYGTGVSKPVSEPLGTVTAKARFGLVQGSPSSLDITLRMFTPKELASATGFPPGYQFTGNKTEQIRQIGNAVCPPVARALVAG
jgi:DNA (cytosine-5)-methyltransferase 1